MTPIRTSHRIAFVLMAWLAAFQTTNAANPDALVRAKELYVAASYDEALAVLDGLREDSADGAQTEVAQYRVFCLLALQRSDEARTAIQDIIESHPFYRLPEEETAPRIVQIFEEVRRSVLPALVERSYAEAKAAFDRKDAAAASRFERLLALLDDPDMKGSPLSDLRTVATGFRDLSLTMASAAPAASAQNDPARTAQPTAAVVLEVPTPGQKVALDNFRPAEPVSQPMPRWQLPSYRDRQYRGALEITIDEHGDVVAAELRQAIHPVFDQELLRLARTWKYKPATLNGVPTRYVKIVEIQLLAPKRKDF